MNWSQPRKVVSALLFALAMAVTSAPRISHAQATLITGLGGTAGFGTNTLAAGDDNSSAVISLTPYNLAGICFFGMTHATLFINNNGNVTFNAAEGGYTPTAFPASTNPMMAPWWADVDTRGTATGIPPENRVYWDIRAGQLVVTWDRVGYYDSHVDKRNTFQLIIREIGTTMDYDVEYRYSELNWTTGDASMGVNGLGGVPAQAGFDAGDNMHFSQLPGSRTASVLNLLTTSNATPSSAGVWQYHFRSCQLACVSNADCGGATPICDATTQACRACTTNSDCGGSTPVCATAGTNAGRCVQCTATANCTAPSVCNTATNLCVGCTSNANCSGGTPICDTTAHVCRSCDPAQPTDCTGGTPICGPAGRCVQCAPGMTALCIAPTTACSTAGTCVQCAAGMTTACTGATPICNTTSGTCRACSTATQAADCPNAATPLCSTVAPTAGTCVAANVTLLLPATGSTTSNMSPPISGTATPGSTVVVYIDGMEIGRTTATALGTWSYTPTISLAVGTHTATAAEAINAGTGPMTAGHSFTVVQCLANTDCSGGTPLCDTTAHVCRGCLSNANCSGSVPVCDTTTQTCRGCRAATQSTDCTNPLAPLCQTAGPSAGSCVPAAATLNTPTAGSTTANMTPPVTGTAPAGSTVVIYIDGMEIGRTTADAAGNFSFTPTMAIALGTHVATVAVAVGMGTGAMTAPHSFTVVQCVVNGDCRGATPLCDTTLHVCRGCLTSADCSGSAPVCDTSSRVCRACSPATQSTDCPSPTAPLCEAVGPMAGGCVAAAAAVTTPADGSTTASTTPPITGTAPAGSTVVIYIDGVEIGRTMANVGGTFSFTPTTPIALGMHAVTAAVAVGASTGAMSAPHRFVIVQCLSSTDCGGSTTLCDVTTNTCRGCLSSADCGGNTPTCDSITSSCRGCDPTLQSVECSNPASPLCETAGPQTGACVPAISTVSTPADGSTITNMTPPVTGTAPPGSTVAVSIDGVEIGRTTADGTGNYSLTPTLPVPIGMHTVSSAVVVGTDTGPSSAPNRFNVVQCVSNGDCSGSTTLCDTTANVCRGCLTSADCSAASPVCDPTTRFCRTCDLATEATDCPNAGAPVCQTIGGAAGQCVPATTTVIMPADGSTTANMSPPVTGTAPPGSTVAVFIDGMQVGTTIADASGMYSLTPALALGVGPHAVTSAVVLGGSTGPMSAPHMFTVVQCTMNSDCGGASPLCDTTTNVCRSCITSADCRGSAPVCDTGNHSCRACDAATQATDCPDPAAPVCATAGPGAGGCVAATVSVDSPANGANITATQPTITGTAPPGSIVVIYVDGAEVGRATADNTGHYTFMVPAELSPGSHGVAAAVAIGAGTGPQSPTNSFNIVQCVDNTTCNGATPVCDPTSNVCLGCVANSDCHDSTPVCDPTAHTCRACGNDSECSGSTPACAGTGACVQCTATMHSQCSGATAVCDASANVCVFCTPGPSGDATACAGSTDGHACEAPLDITSMPFCGCSVDSDCGDAMSGRTCDSVTRQCITGCGPTPTRNGCPTGQFCTSQDPTVIGACTTTCNFDADCTSITGRPICLVSDGGVSQCVECQLDSQCAGRTDQRVLCIGANNTCAQCSATNMTMCSQSGIGAACLPSGLCGCTLDTDCSADHRCNAGTNRCEPRSNPDGGVTDGGVTDGGQTDASVSDTGRTDGGRDGATDASVTDGRASDASLDGSVGADGSTANVTGGGACNCSVPAATHGGRTNVALGLLVGLGLIVSRRRRARRATKSQ